MDLGLTGKVAMVAGASRGLGLAVARALAAEGARVSMLSRDETAVCAAAKTLEQETGAQTLATSASRNLHVRVTEPQHQAARFEIVTSD